MIHLYSLGSGSEGNCFAIEAGNDGVLIVDAGFSVKETQRRSRRVGLDLDRLVGVVLTHEHGDHAGGARRLASRFRVPILATQGTIASLDLPNDFPRVVLRSASVVEIGPYCVSSCRTVHDAIEPTAIAVHWGRIKIGIAYDFGRPTSGVRHLLRGSTALIVESNYDDLMLRASSYPPTVQQRIAGSGGHLSNRVAAELISELIHPGLATVMLAHLSQQCNTPEVALQTVGTRLKRSGYNGALAVTSQHAPVGPVAVHPPPFLPEELQTEFELN